MFVNGVWKVVLHAESVGQPVLLFDVSQRNEIQPVPLHTSDCLNLLTDNKHARHEDTAHQSVSSSTTRLTCVSLPNTPSPTCNAPRL
ncbi:ras association domain-containing protein 1-like protein [Lates japonicus]|uniref:Ras association domain-containing protein 1-like protein n=1 Tax=Lates japonicus TaxID=270547 RepID=A0AAD3M614_LATJO|nr:ras association domain-containing protein 1-like protein [Lates japonicus]